MGAGESCKASLGTPKAHRNEPVDSHAEVRALQRRNGLRWSAHFDLGRSLAAKDVQEEFARRAAESSGRLVWPSHHPLVGSGPLNFEPATVKPPTQVAASAVNVSPQGSIHRRRQATGSSSVRPADILVVNEELVEIRQRPHPPDAEEADGWAGTDSRDEPREFLPLGQSDPTLFGEPFKGPGQNEARASDQIVFAQNEVGGEIISSPALDQCWNRRAQLIEQIAELKALLRV